MSIPLLNRTLSSESVPGSSDGHNQLWIRDLSFVQLRCFTASPVKVGEIEL